MNIKIIVEIIDALFKFDFETKFTTRRKLTKQKRENWNLPTET